MKNVGESGFIQGEIIQRIYLVSVSDFGRYGVEYIVRLWLWYRTFVNVNIDGIFYTVANFLLGY